MDTQIKVCTIVENDNKVLLIKEWSDNKNGHYWNIIKGTFNSTLDKNLIDTAKREAVEEACADISITNYLGIIIKYGFSIRIYVSLVGVLKKGKPHIPPKKEQQQRKEDIIEMKWFTQDELKDLKEEEFINDVAFDVINRWLANDIYPLSLLTEKNLSS